MSAIAVHPNRSYVVPESSGRTAVQLRLPKPIDSSKHQGLGEGLLEHGKIPQQEGTETSPF